VNVSALRDGRLRYVLWLLVGILFCAQFSWFFGRLAHTWLENEEFTFGALIPLIVGYLLVKCRNEWGTAEGTTRSVGLVLVIVGCALQIAGSRMGSLIVCGIALVLVLMGIVGFQWGLRRLRIAAVPLAFLLLMVPLPSYLTGQFQWHLKTMAGTVSAATLRLLQIPVFQDGNFLKLPNYVLEVKQACSGSRSIFALLALAMVLGYVTERKWQTRILLLAAAPVLAVGANVIRIVGTGIIAWNYGDLAANDSLHSAWGVMVFLIAVSGLLGIQRLMRWATNAYA